MRSFTYSTLMYIWVTRLCSPDPKGTPLEWPLTQVSQWLLWVVRCLERRLVSFVPCWLEYLWIPKDTKFAQLSWNLQPLLLFQTGLYSLSWEHEIFSRPSKWKSVKLMCFKIYLRDKHMASPFVTLLMVTYWKFWGETPWDVLLWKVLEDFQDGQTMFVNDWCPSSLSFVCSRWGYCLWLKKKSGEVSRHIAEPQDRVPDTRSIKVDWHLTHTSLESGS